MAHELSSSILHARGLTKRFGGLLAVDSLDLDIAHGEIFGLIGPNGAGKSTTFNLISGFMAPTAGRLYVDGKELTGQKPLTMSAAGLVRTFQHGSYVPSMTVRDNIRLGTIARAGSAQRAERIVEAAEMLELMAVLDEPAGTLPHGLQRLVSIAIAVAARPKLLCLDEPLTGLNETEVGSVLDVLRQYRTDYGGTILLVEHNMKAVMNVCDRILVLHHGKHLATGTPAEIRSNPTIIKAYLGDRHAH
jgi:branched-chain amino acid transport system ATP-binding protein